MFDVYVFVWEYQTYEWMKSFNNAMDAYLFMRKFGSAYMKLPNGGIYEDEV